MPAWLFPVPVRKSRFQASDARLAQFNVESATDLVPPYSFASPSPRDALYFDLQTQLEGNYHGRLGSGRSGVYRGAYLKGIGRTPAAANWNDPNETYHGSGHLSAASAIRERLISVFLAARGLGHTIVPCTAVLIGELDASERRAVGRNQSSSKTYFAAADSALIALTIKPANWARISNFVFALNHCTGKPSDIGTLFLDLQKHLNPPGEQSGTDGTPAEIVDAMENAFHRGLNNFRAWGRAGLFWYYLNSNFTLDGRFMDLETPLYFGNPFVGVEISTVEGRTGRNFFGFEEFGFVMHWRLFVTWLKSSLKFQLVRERGLASEARPFIRELLTELNHRFTPGHALFNDEQLCRDAVANLAGEMDLSRKARTQLHQLARHAMAGKIYGLETPLPDIKWNPLPFRPAPSTPYPRTYEAAAFAPVEPSKHGQSFADATARLGAMTSAKDLLAALASAETLAPRRKPVS